MSKYISTKTGETVDAVRFDYTESAIERLKEFCSGQLSEFHKHSSGELPGVARLTNSETGTQNNVYEGEFLVKNKAGRICRMPAFGFYQEFQDVRTTKDIA